MITRYTLPEMGALFTDEARLAAWLEVEILAVEGWAEVGVIPTADAAVIRSRASFDVQAVAEREAITNHDVAAFVDIVQDAVGQPAGAWVHYGLTSSDVVDTALAWTLTKACDVLSERLQGLFQALVARAQEHANTAMVGRTHGIHAEPTTFGNAVALWALQVQRDIARLQAARAGIAVGKLSGAVGTYSNIDPSVETFVCDRLGLTPVPATQVLARDRHAELLYVFASIGATIETIALQVRHMQRTELREAEEAFATGAQKGSSAMPHKRNPIRSEQLCGLARVLRGNLQAGMENVALWHERDISHSSVERIILPDSAILTHYMVVKATDLIARLVVYPEQMQANLDASYGLVFSQGVLLALVAGGASRDDAYRLVQRNAMKTWEAQRPFREVLGEDSEVTDRLDAAAIDECFRLDRALQRGNAAVQALSHLEG